MVKRRNSNQQNRFSNESTSNFFKILFGAYDYSSKRQALKITCIYFFIGSLWILLSDKLVGFLIKEQSIIIIIGIIKGWIYVFITSVIMFLLIFTEMKKVTESKDKIKKMNDELQDINKVLEEDIHQRNKLHERLQKYRILSEKANDAMLFIDNKGNILEVNDAAIRMYGYTYKEFLSISVFDLRHIEKTARIIEQMEIADKEGIIFETIHYLKDGTSIPVEVSSQGTFFGDKRIILSIVRDITERKKAEKEIIYLSYHDQLTGLYNRRFYEEELIRLNTERNIPITLIMADVNGLKLTNDAFGHKAGDILLERIANVLKMECGANEIITRIGGDEFVILLSRTDEKEAEKIVHRINVAIANEKPDNVIVSISIGFAVKQNVSEDMNEVFKKAEADMYRYKLSESSIMRSKTVDLIMKSLYEKSNTEFVHSKGVSEICGAIAAKMNFEKDDVNHIRIAGLMHDIGKIGINENILNKVGKLNSDEWYEIMRHSEIGYQILRSVNEFSKIADYVLQHHERWNGKGYPKGLKGEEIYIEARIIAVADAYETMISKRTYSEALSEEEAINEIRRCSGIQFDPDIAKIFVEKVLGKVW